MKETKPVNARRYMAAFDVENTTKGDSGRYRCIVQSDRGVGVSSYAELIVKRKWRVECQGQGQEWGISLALEGNSNPWQDIMCNS